MFQLLIKQAPNNSEELKKKIFKLRTNLIRY